MVYHLDQRYYRIHLDFSSFCSTPVDFQVDPNLDNSLTIEVEWYSLELSRYPDIQISISRYTNTP